MVLLPDEKTKNISIVLLIQLGAQVSPAKPTSHLGVGLPAKGLEIFCVWWIDERVLLLPWALCHENRTSSPIDHK